MAFIGFEFLIFFLIVLALYWLLPNPGWQNFLLFASSLIFYGWLASWHGAILFASILVDFLLALGMARWRNRSVFLMWLGIILNLALLISVKYFAYYNETLAAWSMQAGFAGDVFLTTILLPLGTSFYTLKKISYLVEVQRGTLRPQPDFIAFGAYAAFFPQVFSGPIERPQAFLRQLQEKRAWAADHFYNAWPLTLMGLFKKIVIANTVKVLVDQIFLMKEPSKVFLIVGGLGFTLQILADFSSYTDLSRGIAFLLGLKTAENFNTPYLALTPNDFWNRWHISFSSWLRDYIFFPVRRILLRVKHLPGIFSQIIPPLLTMFISGVWHGTGSTFILWGVYYGILIIIYQTLGIRGEAKSFKRFFLWLAMFAFIVFGWMIFRAGSLSWLWNALMAPFSRASNDLIAAFVLLVMISFYASLLFSKHLLDVYAPKKISLHALYYALAAGMTIVFMNSSSPDFIYFQF
ncbi:MAG: MBOAT family protein [Chloroflexi bacterium]|nr:MBOAT family protein [Chloroflexota bacterium]